MFPDFADAPTLRAVRRSRCAVTRRQTVLSGGRMKVEGIRSNPAEAEVVRHRKRLYEGLNGDSVTNLLGGNRK